MTDDELREKIITSWIRNHRENLILLPDLRRFLKVYFKINMREQKREEVVKVVQEHLTTDTLNTYINGLKDFGLLVKDISEVFDVSEYKARKIMDSGQVRFVYKKMHYTDYNTIVRIGYIPDIVKLYHLGELQPKKRKSVQLVEMTDENVAQALYIINKSAKKSRDTKNKKYEQGDHCTCHAAKTRMTKLYEIKDSAMEKLIGEERMTYIGINRQELPNGNVNFLKLYSFGGYTFHVPCNSSDIDEQDLLDSTINDLISAECHPAD